MLASPDKCRFDTKRPALATGREFTPLKHRPRFKSDFQSEMHELKPNEPVQPKTCDVRKRKSLLSKNKLILDPREEPLRDSIQRSNAKLEKCQLHLKTGEAVHSRAYSMFSRQLNSTSLTPKKYRFVNPLTLPEKKSPTRYGNYLVRVFDGDLSQTKQEYIKKTFPHNSKNKHRKSFIIPQKGLQVPRSFDSSTASSSHSSTHSNGSSNSKAKSFRLRLLAQLKNSLFKTTAQNSINFKLPSPASIISEKDSIVQSPETIMSRCPSPTKTEGDRDLGRLKDQERKTFTVMNSSMKKPDIEGRVRFPSFSKTPSLSYHASRKSSIEQQARRTSGVSAIYTKTKKRLNYLMSECKENLANKTCHTQPVSGIMTPLAQGEIAEQGMHLYTEASKSPRERINGVHQLMMLGRRCKVNMGDILKRELSINDEHERHAERIYYELMKRLDHSNSYVRDQVQSFHLKKPLPGLRNNQSYEEF